MEEVKRIKELYMLLESKPSDGDITFEEKYDIVRNKYDNYSGKLEELEDAYHIIKRDREKVIKPGDAEGEERCLNNIYDALIQMRKEIRNGKKKNECRLLLGKIMNNILFMEQYWMHATIKHLKNNNFEKYCVEAYSDVLHNFYMKNLERRILGSKEDKVFGWLKNYSEDKGDFIHYARKSIAHMRTDLKSELVRISTVGLDEGIVERYAQQNVAAKEEDKKQKDMQKKLQKNVEKYNAKEICKILAVAPTVLEATGKKNSNSQAIEYAKYYMVNVAMTLLEAIEMINPTAEDVDRFIEYIVNQTDYISNVANTNDIFESMSQELTNYIKSEECTDFEDVIHVNLRSYADIGVEQDGQIRIFKNGIKYIDDILVNFYDAVKGDSTKKIDSIKTIRTRNWNKFKELINRRYVEE